MSLAAPLLPGDRLQQPSPISKHVKAAGLWGLLVVGGAWLGQQAQRFRFQSQSSSSSAPFVPSDGVDSVTVRPGGPTLLAAAPYIPAKNSPSCIFTYVHKASGNYPPSEQFAQGSTSNDGWVYGAKLFPGQKAAQVTGNPADIVKARLLCWPADKFAGKLEAADALMMFNPVHADQGILRRGVAPVVSKEGKVQQAHFYYQVAQGGGAERSFEKHAYSYLRLNTGANVPQLGFGTFLAKPGEVGQAVRQALDSGYRHLDCAAVYQNQAEIGEVLHEYISQGKIKREELFVTSKLWIDEKSAAPSKIAASFKQTLSELRLDYLNLYLVHLPVVFQSAADGSMQPVRARGWGLQDVWREMEKLYDSGKAKAIGVSNYNVQTLNDLLTYARIPPAVNQVEMHPYLAQPELRAFCKQNNIVVTAFAPLGAPGLMGAKAAVPLLENPVIVRLAKKYGKTPAQVLVRWSIDVGAVVIPKSVTPSHVVENFAVLDFKLSEEDLASVAPLNVAQRFFEQDWMGIPLFF